MFRSIYRLNSARAAWQVQIKQKILDPGFTSYLDEPYVWMSKDVKNYVFKYWWRVLIKKYYTIEISHESCIIMEFLAKEYNLKRAQRVNILSMIQRGNLDQFLVSYICLMTVELHCLCWGMIMLNNVRMQLLLILI